MQLILNHSIDLIALLFFVWLIGTKLKILIKGDHVMNDETMMQAFTDLERRKAIRARAFLKGVKND